MSEPQAILNVNKNNYGGWKTVRAGMSIESISGYYELGVTDRWPLQKEPREIKIQDDCELFMGETSIIKGIVDDVDTDGNFQAHNMVVRGRDTTADVVDSSAVYKTGSFENQSFTDIATRLCQPHNVSVRATVSTGDKITKHAITPGETIFESLELLARQRGVLLMPDAGNVQVTKPGTEVIDASLVMGKNILTYSVQRSRRERFAKYIVLGQSQGSATLNGAAASEPRGEVADPLIRGNRTRVIVAEGAATAKDCQTRATWARNVAAGRSERAVYTVQGWTFDGKTIWPINKLVYVDDDRNNIHRNLLIVAVAFVKGEEGTITELTLAPREAYETIAQPELIDDQIWAKP